MNTLAKRLKYALYSLSLNQAEAAKKSGISQQSINYIIRNNLTESRLSSKIADGLRLNPEWLIYGRGEMISPNIYKIPIITDYLSLQLYFNNREIDKNAGILLTHRFIGVKPFAVKTEKNKLCICIKHQNNTDNSLIEEHLFFNDAEIKIVTRSELTKSNETNFFRIVEWRIYDVTI